MINQDEFFLNVDDPRDFLISSYDFHLDDELIAQSPAEPRHSSKLMIVDKEAKELASCRHARVWNLQDELIQGDLLVLNNTRVIRARLNVRRHGGGRGELLLIEPKGEGKWLCLARPAKRMRIGDQLSIDTPEHETICLEIVSDDPSTGGRVVQFPSFCLDRESIEPFLNSYGQVPLPPYIQSNGLIHQDRYQTLYADSPGAVAAPTAGLHLSGQLLEALLQKGISITRVTLHVGLGTFKPIDIEDLNSLELHSEWVEVREEVVQAVEECKARGGRIIAVGTTSVRALEGAFLAGGGRLKPLRGKVNLVIKPGYRFGVVDGLLTNFHLPKSSLLLLVSAVIGRERLLALYAEAIKCQYRFYSFGDAMFIAPKVTNY